MEKNKSLITIAIVLLVVIVACIAGYFITTTIVENNLKKEKAAQEEYERQMTEPLYTLENYPKVDASLATQPLTNAFIKNFTGIEDIDVSTLGYTNTHPGYLRLVDGEVDLIVVTQPSEDELQYAADHGVELEVTPVVKEGFVFYVNKQNPVESLTTDQIQGIYSGEITNWKEVGGDDAEIVAYQRPRNSGSQTGMENLVMKDKTLMEPKTENLLETMAEIINYVSNYNNGKYALGYSYLYYATTMFETIDPEVASNIKLLAINDVKPTAENIQAETYPYNTAYYIVTRKADGEDSAAYKLKNIMLSERGQRVAQKAGYVPVTPVK